MTIPVGRRSSIQIIPLSFFYYALSYRKESIPLLLPQPSFSLITGSQQFVLQFCVLSEKFGLSVVCRLADGRLRIRQNGKLQSRNPT